jgi:LemA protein
MFLAAMGLAGLLGVVVGIIGWRRYWVVKDTPTSRCAAVFVGRNEVVGEAQPVRPLLAPMSGQQCVWFTWELERKVVTRDSKGNTSTRWQSVAERTSVSPFRVVDESGEVLVWPEGATLHTDQSVHEPASRSEVPYSLAELQAMTEEGELPAAGVEPEREGGFLGFVKDLFDGNEHEPIGSLGGGYRVSERRLDIGEHLYVLGHAAMRDDTVALEFSRGHGPLLVSNRSEGRVAAGGLAMAIFGLLLGAAAVGALGYGVAVVAGAVGAVAVYGAFVLGLYGVRLYNRLVAVKEQAAAAWSLIDVGLRRRHDLLPNLVEVVKRYAVHEAEALTAVALPREEVLPSDETLARATTANEVERHAGRTLVALGEAYPDLQADELFRDLADRIVHQEDQVAYAGTFYNDAVTVLRDRRQAFPGNLLARFVTTPSWNLFDAERDTWVPPLTQPR